MRVLVLGGTGFIGSHVARAIAQAGHEAIIGARPVFDLSRDTSCAAWVPRLQGIDAVVNAAGVFQAPATELEAVHLRGPVALFEACAALGIPVVHFSALGADEAAATDFHRTKRSADAALLAMDVHGVVLQPSLVFGEGGASAELLAALAASPLVPLPAGGRQLVQPVHIDDVCAVVVNLLARRSREGRIALVGPEPITLRDYLATLRKAMGLGRARFATVPPFALRLGDRMGIALASPDALAMLARGNTADSGGIESILGRPPRAYRDFIAARASAAVRTRAQMPWLRGVLRGSLAAVWFWAAITSLFLYPREASLALLAPVGLTGTAAWAALWAASLLDLGFAIATLVFPSRALWLAQLLLVLGYTAVITVALPEQWLHPFGPVVKNLPILAILVLLFATERQ